MVSEGLLVALSPLKLETLLLCSATITVVVTLACEIGGCDHSGPLLCIARDPS
jgi:hypothetical protein